MHAICLGKMRLIWCFYGVTYNFIQNHNSWRDLHQFFSCLFETFGTMSAIMFLVIACQKKFNSWKYMNVYFRLQHHCFGMVGKQWFKNLRMTVISSFPSVGWCLMLICSWTHRGSTWGLLYLWVMSPFFVSSWCVNLIRMFLHDDTLHQLECLNASWTFLVLQQQQNLGRRFWYQ